MGMNVNSDLTFDLWKYVFQVPQYGHFANIKWKKMLTNYNKELVKDHNCFVIF